jgi:multidrug efflux pump subunit AcrB
VYKAWKERGAALSQDRIVSGLNRKLSDIQEAFIFVAIPPPIRGLGQTGGFQMMVQDRRSLGLAELQRNAAELVQAGNSNPSLRGLASTFSYRSPQLYLDIDRTKAESLQVQPSAVFETLQAYLGSSFVNFFNSFNQVFQVYIQADSRYRLEPNNLRNLYVRNQSGGMVPLNTLIEVRRVQGTELVTRYNLYPAAAIFGACRAGIQLRRGPEAHGTAGRREIAGGHGVRLDLDELSGKEGRLPGLLDLRPLSRARVPGPGGPVRELDVARGGHLRRPHRPGRRAPGAHEPRLRQQPLHPGRSWS